MRKFFLSALALTFSVAILAACSPAQPAINEPSEQPEIIFQENEFDFGVIKQSAGIQSHEFSFTYNGEQPVKITGTPGSCACTTASVNVSELEKGETGVLTVEFDPNLHEEPEGKFYKTVAILTEPPLQETPEVKIWAEIDLDLGPEAYKLKEHYDGDGHDD